MKRLTTCAECGALLTDRHEIAERTCAACLQRWFDDAMAQMATAVIGVPTRALRAAERTEAKAS